MTTELAIVLVLLAAAVVMFVLNRPRMDAVGLLMLVLLPFTGAITVNEALAGFADPNVVLIAALFVIGEGLVRTGVARRARGLAGNDGREQRDAFVGAADAGLRRARRGDEWHGGGRHLRPDRAAASARTPALRRAC